MSYIVVSSFENVETGDLQAQGEAIAVFASEVLARTHFAGRASALEKAARAAREADGAATFIAWIVIFRMPLDVADVDEALEDLETIIEETDSVDDPFGELVVDYQGTRHEPSAAVAYPQKEALQAIEGWLT